MILKELAEYFVRRDAKSRKDVNFWGSLKNIIKYSNFRNIMQSQVF